MSKPRWAIALWSVFVSVTLLITGGVTPQRTHADGPAFGADLIAPGAATWEHERALFREMRGDAARFRVAPGFGGRPEQVAQLIDDGARTVVLTTGDCAFTPEDVRAQVVDRGYLRVIEAHPGTRFILELGNEPNLCGMDPWAARFWFLQTRRELDWMDRANLDWMPSMPTQASDTAIVLSRQSDGAVGDLFDAIAVHNYGDYNLWPLEDHYAWGEVFDLALTQTDLPIWVTEAGINDPSTSKAEKARRILAAREQMPGRVQGVLVFAITDADDPRWPQYTVTAEQAAIYAAREGSTPEAGARWFPETGHSLGGGFRAYWEAHGGIAQQGYPLTEEFHGCNEDGWCGTMQVFERAVFEYHPENRPPHDILLRRLGAEWLERS